MNNLSALLDYFNERLKQEMKNNTQNISLEKEKLHDLLVQIELMRRRRSWFFSGIPATPLEGEGFNSKQVNLANQLFH